MVAVLAVFLTISWAVNSSTNQAQLAALSVAAVAPPPAVVNQPYTYALQASGGQAPYQWSVVEGKLPEGLTLEPEGIIRGQSSATGVYDVRIQVKEAGSEASSASQQFSLTVKLGPKIKSEETLAPALVGRDYSCPLGVEGGQRPYRWAVTSGSVPPGISLNAFSGFLGGRPQAAGTYRFSISVSDLFGATSTRPFEMTVRPVQEGGAGEKVDRMVRAAALEPPSASQRATGGSGAK
jgi:hypothetical protein